MLWMYCRQSQKRSAFLSGSDIKHGLVADVSDPLMAQSHLRHRNVECASMHYQVLRNTRDVNF